MTSAITLPHPALVAEAQDITLPCQSGLLDPDAWFPSGDHITAQLLAQEAKALCAYSCPLQAMCRDYAMAARERWGLWGGLTEAERDTLRRGKQLRNIESRWLAGLTDRDGNPIDDADSPAA